MNKPIYERLTEKVVISDDDFYGNFTYFTPADPFGVFLKLGKIYFGKPADRVIRVEPQSIFDNNLYWRDVFRRVGTIKFTKWWYQELPKCFWLYTSDIIFNKELLKQSANNSDPDTIWISMKDTKNKTKLVKIESSNVLDDLRSGKTFLPSYEQIAKEVDGWGGISKHFVGPINQQLITWRNHVGSR